MPKTPLFTIDAKDFSRGMVKNVQGTRGFATTFACDIHTNPGEVRVSRRMEADDDTIFQTNTEFPEWYEAYDADGGTNELYAYGNEGRLYRRTAGAWAQIRAVAAADGQGLKHFQTSLYYGTRAGIGQLQGDPTGANYTDAFQAFTVAVGSTAFTPMAVFVGSLFVGNGRRVSKLSSDQTTWDADALILPVGFEVSAMIVWNDRLVIATKSGSNTTDERIFLWDGVSEFPELAISVPKPGASALFNYNNFLKAFITHKIYKFTGTDFEIEVQVPKTRNNSDTLNPEVRPGAVELYEDRMLFGMAQDAVNGETGFLSGIYSLGRHSDDFPTALALDFPVSTGETGQMIIGALKVFGTENDKQILFAGYEDQENGLDVVDIMDNGDRYPSEAYLLLTVFDLPGNYGKLIEGVRVEFAGQISDNAAINKVVVSFRVDDDIDQDDDTTNFTVLGTIDRDTTGNNNHDEVLSGVYERPHKIQFKFELTTNAAQVSDNLGITKIHVY